MAKTPRAKRGKQAASAGAAIGATAIGGLPGAAAGQAIQLVSTEMLERALSAEERRRITGLYEFAILRLEERLEAGETLRNDDFFSLPSELGARLSAPWGARRPPGVEVFEALLTYGGRTYEERKLPHLGELQVALAFAQVKPEYAHYLVRLANELSYRQYVLLRIFAGDTRQPGLAKGDVPPESPTALGMELEDLARRGLIGTNEPGADAYPASSILGVGLSFINTTRDGRRLYELMRLDAVNQADADGLIKELGRATDGSS